MDRYNIADWLNEWLIQGLGLAEGPAAYIKLAILILILACICALSWYLTKKFIQNFVYRATAATKITWDDILVEKKVFDTAAHIVPAIFINLFAPYVFGDFPGFIPVVNEITDIFIIVVIVAVINKMLNTTNIILSQQSILKDKPINSFIQLTKLFVFIFAGIFIISLLIGKSPVYILSGIGAMAAVLLLVFKDTLLGFVASVQLSANDMVRVGDWVSMPKYGADGDVIAIHLTTIKVQNWDKTISTIPAYTFISDSFKNWRGMEESGGRRITRCLYINTGSIKFCNSEMMERFKKIQLVKDYVEQREKEIDEYNRTHKMDKTELINGRHMTNIGVFRRFAEEYLRKNTHINQEMTLMVRQLEPSEKGLPLQVYCFSTNKNWVAYEGIIGDIFDYLLAAAPRFDLEIYQNPSGSDVRLMAPVNIR